VLAGGAPVLGQPNWVYQAVEDGRLPYRRLGPRRPHPLRRV
jgi:hypothetical protein